MNYWYGKGIQKYVLYWKVVPFSEGPLSEVPLIEFRLNPLYTTSLKGSLLITSQSILLYMKKRLPATSILSHYLKIFFGVFVHISFLLQIKVLKV